MTPEQVRSSAAKIARDRYDAINAHPDVYMWESQKDAYRSACAQILSDIEAIPLPAPQPPSVDPFAEELAKALEGLINAAIAEVNERGAGGYMLARLSDARTALAAWRAKRGGQP